MEPLSNYNEKELLSRLAKADEAAFRMLYDQYKDGIYAFALAITRSVPQAEEIVQESFIRLWLHQKDIPGIIKFENWLFTIARNLCYSALHKIALEEKARWAQENIQNADSFSPEEILISRENRALIEQAINHLPNQQRQVYRLRRDEGLSYDEISKKLQISRNTVKEHVIRANNSIRRFLQGHMAILMAFLIHLHRHF